MRIAHIADVHLDRPFAGLAGEQGDLARQRLRRTFTRCLELAKDRNADLITIGGDLWEEENVRVDTRRFVAKELENTGLPVLVICGNHDPYLAGGSYERTEWPGNVTVVASSDPTEIAFDGVSIWGLSWTGVGLEASFLETFRAPGDGRHVLLIHGTSVRIEYFDEQSAHCPFKPDAVRAAGFELCLSGHIHRASHVDGVVYPGSPEPLGWAETGDHCVAIVELGDRIEVELIPINEHRYEHVQVDCAGCDSSAEIAERLQAALPTEDAAQLHVRAVLGGEIDRECEVSTNLLAAELVSDYAQIEVVDSTIPSYDLDHLAQQETVSGLFVRELQDQIDAAVDDREREKLELALVAGLRALDGRADVVHVD